MSSTANDGGFESDTPGRFPDSGYWSWSSAAGAGTGVCSTAAAYTGIAGLRNSTGPGQTDTWISVLQERAAYTGDVYRAGGYLRQPSGTGWVGGSEGYIRLTFLDYWHGVITNYISSNRVTSAGQNWTLCEIGDCAAPFGTRYVRVELVVTKPESAGTSTVDFDDAYLGQGNSFNGDFAEDPSPPEGSKVFRSYCVY